LNALGSLLLPEEFSVCDCDRYAEHLAEISVRRRMVVADGDVCNQFGILLLPGGTPLGSVAFGKMRGHRLNRPVDEALCVRRRLDAPALTTRLHGMLAAAPDLQQIHDRHGFDQRLVALVAGAALGPVALQKLSVLEEVLPLFFHRALFCAWLGALLGAERALPAEEIGALFLAGLLHDLGLLHIEPELVDKKSEISAREWSVIQRHVPVGAGIACSLAGLPARVARVIAQHHERADGSGYPAGSTEQDIDPLAAIVGLCDMLHALRFPVAPSAGGSISDCLAYLRVNRAFVGAQNYAAAARILQLARGVPAGPVMPRPLLLDANHSLVRLRRLLAAARPLLAQPDAGAPPPSLLRQLDQFERVSDASGLGQQDVAVALGRSIDAESRGAGLGEIERTARELLWLVRRIDRQLQTALAATRAAGAGGSLGELAHDIQFELRRAWQRFAC
jgi:hypothetical protein